MKNGRRRTRFHLVVLGVVAVAMCLPLSAAAEPAATSRIVGGEEASIADYPYAVFVTDGSELCGGALIGPAAVATAAHCATAMSKSRIQVVAGRQDVRTHAGVVARVASEWIAPGFKDPEQGDDVAVLKLDRTVPYQWVRLADGSDAQLYAPDTKATVLGWGRTTEGGARSDTLRKATVPLVSDADCSASYRSYDARTMVCAGYPQGGVDACQGDSGGPLVVDGTLIGLVSWGEGCAEPGKPGVYTRVSTYADDLRAASRVGFALG